MKGDISTPSSLAIVVSATKNIAVDECGEHFNFLRIVALTSFMEHLPGLS